MRNTNFIFIILIIAAAVITGSTVAIANNFDLITAQLDINQTGESGKQMTETTKKDGPTVNLQEMEFTNPTKDIGSSELPDITFDSHEQEQVIKMLYALGMVNGTDWDEFIHDFQKSHALEPTGELDAQTLSLIIDEVKLKKNNSSQDAE